MTKSDCRTAFSSLHKYRLPLTRELSTELTEGEITHSNICSMILILRYLSLRQEEALLDTHV